MNQRINASYLHIRNLKQKGVVIMIKAAQVFGKIIAVKKSFLGARQQLRKSGNIVFTLKVRKLDT